MSLPSLPPRPNRPNLPSPSSGPVPPPASPVPPTPQPLPPVAPQPTVPYPSQPGSAHLAGAGEEYAPLSQEPSRPAPRVEEPRNESGLTAKKPLLIGGAVGAGVLLLAGGAFAYNALAPAPGGPEEAVPASAILFAKVDLDPSADQKMAALELQDKFSEMSGEELTEDGSFREVVSSAFFDDLDYATEVDPWLGDRFAVSALENSVDPSSAHMIAVYSIKDAAKAEDAAAQIEEPSFVYDDKYLVLSDTEESLDAWKSSIESEGALSDSKDYRDDMKKLDGDTIASVWVDVERASSLSQEAAYQTGVDDMGLLQEAVTGSVVGGIHLEKNAVQAQVVAIGTGVESEWDISNGSVSDVNNLPGDTVVAFAAANLDKVLTGVWNEYSSEIDEYTLEQIESLGLSLPEDFNKIIGTQTALGISYFPQNSDIPGMVARLKGADESVLQRLSEDSGASQDVSISTDGDSVVLSSGEVADSKLGDSERFKNALPNRDDALAIGYVDIDALLAQMDEPTEESFGSVGASLSYDKKSDIGDLTVRWVFNE